MKIRKSLLIEVAKNRPEAYLKDVYSCVESEDVQFIYISQHNYIKLKNKYTIKHGSTGTELKRLIDWFPIPKGKNCDSCRALEAKMNKWGPSTCEIKKQYILKKLEIAAKRRGLPFSKRLVTILIDKAIRAST